MRLQALLTADSRAASEVVGVILMVAVTVIIASVIGAFVLGTGDRTSETVPQASFSYDFDDQTNVTITHDGGETIDNETIRVTVDGDEAYPDPDGQLAYSGDWDDGSITSGDSIDIHNSSTGENIAETGDIVRIIWDDPSGGSSNELSEREWP